MEMKKVLLLFGMIALMSACAGNTKTSENDSIVVIEEVVDTLSVDTVDTVGVDSLVINQ
jgi:hypothetical protein